MSYSSVPIHHNIAIEMDVFYGRTRIIYGDPFEDVRISYVREMPTISYTICDCDDPITYVSYDSSPSYRVTYII